MKKCNLCGFCKAVCPLFKVSLKESNSARAFALLLKKERSDKHYYTCCLCNACKEECPAGIDIAAKIREKRVELAEKIDTKSSRTMIRNIRQYGDPYGELEGSKGST